MKVSISVGGRFHAFYLAKYLFDRNHLKELVTSYPKFEVKKYGIPRTHVKSIILKELLQRGYSKLTGKPISGFITAEIFDFIASFLISKNSDVYVIWSSYGKRTIQKIRRKNKSAVIFIERGSTHIVSQKGLLTSAFLGAGIPVIPWQLPAEGVIKKEQWEYGNCDYITIPTRFVKSTFLDHGIAENRLFLNSYGVSLESFYPAEPRQEPGPLKVMFAGYLSVRKGGDIWLKVADHFSGSSEIRFQIVGGYDPIFRPRVEKLTGSGHLSFIPYVPQSSLVNYYHQNDVFLFPSYEEGFAMVLLQAAACKLVIVATPNSGAETIVENGTSGFILNSFSPESYISILENLMKDRETLTLLKTSIGTRIREFTWDNYCSRYANRMAEACENRKG